VPLSMSNLFDISSQLFVVEKGDLTLVLVYNCTTFLSDIRRAKKDDEKRISSMLSYYFDISKRSTAFLQVLQKHSQFCSLDSKGSSANKLFL
jgi:hypothetical protein